jgi:hypothetical protein
MIKTVDGEGIRDKPKAWRGAAAPRTIEKTPPMRLTVRIQCQRRDQRPSSAAAAMPQPSMFSVAYPRRRQRQSGLITF